MFLKTIGLARARVKVALNGVSCTTRGMGAGQRLPRHDEENDLSSRACNDTVKVDRDADEALFWPLAKKLKRRREPN